MTTKPICNIRPSTDAKPPHAAKQSVSEQEAKQTGTEESGGKTAQQSAPEKAGPGRRLTNRAGFARLSHRALHWRCGIGRRLC